MTDFSTDPVHNTIQEGIKEDIRVVIDHGRWRAAIILIYAGMDAMAVLNMPANQSDVTATDFIAWASNYIRFPGKEQITGEDFYGARCAMLHAYTAYSRMSRQGRCRLIGYSEISPVVNGAQLDVIDDPSLDPNFVMTSVTALRDAFFLGIDRFLVDVFSNKAKAAVAEERLKKFTHLYDRQQGHFGEP